MITSREDIAQTVRSLRGLDEALPEVEILGVRHGSRFVAESPSDIDLREGDEIIVFGRRERIEQLASSA